MAYFADAVSGQYGGLEMIIRPIWKCPYIKLFITYFRHLEKRHPYWPETKLKPILARANMTITMTYFSKSSQMENKSTFVLSKISELITYLSVRSKQQAVKLVFVASPLSMQYFRSNSKDGLARCQNNVSVWNDMSTHRLLFQ
jgi:hypothetical protein